MASSVARMPSDEWRHRHPSRLHLHTHKSLHKVLTRISTSIDPEDAAAAAAASKTGGSEPCSPEAAAKRRQSQILDRWAARQAREMITTIERQAHEAEISALSTTTQPVSARAASFLRDTSPDGGVGGAVASDIPPNLRASSLIQMWRELEADAGVCPTPRSAPPLAAVEEASGESDTCDEAESCVDWENAASLSSAESEMTEKRKVGEIVRMLSLRISSSAASSSDESESMAVKEVNAPLFVRSPSMPAKLPSPSTALTPSPKRSSSGKAVRLRGRREMEDLFLRMEQDRRREIAAVAERHPVSRFPFRGRIQSLIRLRSLRREVAAIKHQQRSRKLEAEIHQNITNDLFLREGSDDRIQKETSQASTEEAMSEPQVQPTDSRISSLAIPADDPNGGSRRSSELASKRNRESSPPQSFYSSQACFTPLSRHEETQECSSPEALWDERSLWGSSIDWQMPSESPSLQAWSGGEAAAEGQNAAPAECNWLSSETADSCGGWGAIRRTFYDDLQSMKFGENREIRELLEMKAVSTSLASGFSAKMNRIIASFLQRQGQLYADENRGEESEKQGMWRLNYESGSDQEAAVATPSYQLPSEMFHNQESWQSISLPLSSRMLQRHKGWQISSPDLQEGEGRRGLSESVAQIHHEISELRKLVESCVGWQKKVEHSIKREVSSAVNQLAGNGNLFYNSNCMPGKKDNCCICCEAQVDSLLYRCGHMCACYKCAQELQWSSGRCPICRSRIADVIRAYPNS